MTKPNSSPRSSPQSNRFEIERETRGSKQSGLIIEQMICSGGDSSRPGGLVYCGAQDCSCSSHQTPQNIGMEDIKCPGSAGNPVCIVLKYFFDKIYFDGILSGIFFNGYFSDRIFFHITFF